MDGVRRWRSLLTRTVLNMLVKFKNINNAIIFSCELSFVPRKDEFVMLRHRQYRIGQVTYCVSHVDGIQSYVVVTLRSV